MKYSTQPTLSNLESDFGPEWSKHLSTTIPSNPELVIIEQEAWKDQAHMRDKTPALPRPVDPSMLLASSATPRREDYNLTHERENNAGFQLEQYDPMQWALVKYDFCQDHIERAKAHQLRVDWKTKSFAKKIMLYVLLAVLLHGIWTNWEESEKRDTCSCTCPPCTATDV